MNTPQHEQVLDKRCRWKIIRQSQIDQKCRSHTCVNETLCVCGEMLTGEVCVSVDRPVGDYIPSGSQDNV